MYCSREIFHLKLFVSKKFMLNVFCGCCFPTKIFSQQNNFRLAIFAYDSKERGATSVERRVGTEVRTARTTNERVVKGELLSWLPCLFGYLGYGNWRASACHVFNSPAMNAIDMLLL